MAERYNVSVRTVDNWMTRRVIPYVKIDRLVLFDPVKTDEALDRFEYKVSTGREPKRSRVRR